MNLLFSSLSESLSGFDDRVEVVSEGGVALVLPFYKNARRLLHDLPRPSPLASLAPTTTITSALAAGIIAAPSVHTVSALVQLGILTPAAAAAGSSSGGGAIQSGSLADDVAVRCAAVVACHLIAEQLQRQLQGHVQTQIAEGESECEGGEDGAVAGEDGAVYAQRHDVEINLNQSAAMYLANKRSPKFDKYEK